MSASRQTAARIHRGWRAGASGAAGARVSSSDIAAFWPARAATRRRARSRAARRARGYRLTTRPPGRAPDAAFLRPPLPASTKVFVDGTRDGVRVPMREIALTNGERVTVYDTSGPYTDPAAAIDLRRGLAAVRAGWIEARGDTGS